MTDPIAPHADLLDQLIDEGNKALNDYYHDRACSCSTWPEKCASWKAPGDMFFGYWDTDAFAIALPAIIAAYEAQRAASTNHRSSTMTDTTPLEGERLRGIRYRAARPSQHTSATIRQDYADMLNEIDRLRDRLQQAGGAA